MSRAADEASFKFQIYFHCVKYIYRDSVHKLYYDRFYTCQS